MDARQIELDRRAFADLAVDFHMPARLLDEAVDLRKPQARAVSDVLGREERIEGLGLHLRRHSAAGVRHGQHDILAGHHFGLRGGVFFIEMNIRGFDRQLAAIRHRVARIDGEIEDRELELIGIGMRPPNAAAQNGFDRDLLAEGPAQQVRHAGDEPAEIDRFGIERLLARKGEKPLGQRFRAARAPHRIVGGPLEPFRVDRRNVQSCAARFRDCR